jgi:hypothetical protein
MLSEVRFKARSKLDGSRDQGVIGVGRATITEFGTAFG